MRGTINYILDILRKSIRHLQKLRVGTLHATSLQGFQTTEIYILEKSIKYDTNPKSFVGSLK